MLLGLCGCSGSSPQIQESQSAQKTLYGHGLDVIALMEEMANMDTYLDMNTGSPEIREKLGKLRDSDFSAPLFLRNARII